MSDFGVKCLHNFDHKLVLKLNTIFPMMSIVNDFGF